MNILSEKTLFKKQKNQIEKELEWSDIPVYEVPNVIGKSKEDVKELLSNFTVEYAGSGEKIVDQSPNGGTRVERDTVVRLLLGS